MRLRRHIDFCNRYDPARFLPLLFGTDRLGRVRRDNAEVLRRFPSVFHVADDRVELVASGGFDALTEAVDQVVETLVREGLVPKWRNEFFAVAPHWGAEPVFKIDRGVVAFFGVRAYGVHLNGFRRDEGKLLVWIGRRALDKKVAPGKLDNIVAGGIGFGHGLSETLLKEAAEEADLPGGLVRQSVPVGAVSYRMENDLGVRDDVLFLYDLIVPAGVTPRNTDGEIDEFHLMDAGDILRLVRETDEFKFNVNLTLLDFFVRHGVLTPDDPEYVAVVTGLCRPIN